MEDKENANGSIWNQADSTSENNFVSPKALNSPVVLKQIMSTTNCSPLNNTTITNCSPLNNTTIGIFESAAAKVKVMSFTQTFLQRRNTKEKQIKPVVPFSVPHISEKHKPGSYHGRIVSSKINSFRKIPANEARKNSLSIPLKSGVKAESTANNTKDAKVTGTASAPKLATTPFQTRPVRVSVYHPKPILDHEKQSLSTTKKGAAQGNHDKGSKSLGKTVPADSNNSVHRTKKLATFRTVSEGLTAPVSDSIDKKKTLAKSADLRRAQLAEWRASKGTKKVPDSITANSKPEGVTCQKAIKEPVESFWATIAEEDEQGLLRDKVTKTLAECLHLIEKGYPGETVHSTLDKLIVTVPDTKKLAKYWVCQMRLEQFRSVEKVLGLYENAILAGAQPKDELRHTLADVLKARKDLPKPKEECAREETVDEGKTEALKEVCSNNKVESSNEETSQESSEVCMKPKQEGFSRKKTKSKDQSQKTVALKKEEWAEASAEKDRLLEVETPENEKIVSYLIKYNLSTTSQLQSAKKKLNSDDSTVKDLKFLTPVRRSCRIQEKTNKLPSMLKDHSPCVSSLEQLEEFGDEGTGFIYRPNSALQEVSVYQQEQRKE